MNRFADALRALIETEIQRQRDILENGVAETVYWKHIGELKALRRVVDSYLAEAEEIVNKR